MSTSTTETVTQERAWMEQAVELATTSALNGGGPFGALVVKNGVIIASANNQVTSTCDPTAHAEVNAIRAAGAELGTFMLDGCTLISSCEPCPMCLAASLWARVDRLIYAADRDDAAVAGFDDRVFYTLLEKKPQAAWPMEVEHLDLPNRTAPFDAWIAKSDRIDY
ncbi:nucleoside deaminase [Streptomyces sp. LHD-70]|uniref:nucleoside deaminase n=1 Tax=Streptomyces sp. LHD-70 TaxID=3072140 RepID=UPI0028105E9B|nr:nucleoside deaminase [Streptomyces sp. LHD-70]MDQ8703797.1 nucleoside deaminase [Streptomyces sp. LHD-70]